MPSNLALHRVGARRWLSFLVIVWGIIATLFATLKVLLFAASIFSLEIFCLLEVLTLIVLVVHAVKHPGRRHSLHNQCIAAHCRT